MRKNKQGLRDLNFKQGNKRAKDQTAPCSHEWVDFAPRILGMKSSTLNEPRKKCTKCDEISVTRFIRKEFKHGEL